MSFETTAIYALPLGVIYLALWYNVMRLRPVAKVSIGDGGNTELHIRIRQHGNFVEWVPIVLIMMILAEGLGTASIFVHISGVLLVGGRVAHPFGLKAKGRHPLRVMGMVANVISLIVAMVSIAIGLAS